jgi:hypothetical protein
MWRCVIVNEPVEIHGKTYDGDYAGVVQGFTTDQIERTKTLKQAFERGMDDHERFYSTLPVGAIVHYDNGFAQFIRCERVEGPKGKRLRPLALIGNWNDHDLPRRRPDGSVQLGFQAEKIANGDCFEPYYGNIWESYDAKRREWSMRGLTASSTAHLNDIGRARFAEQRYQAPFDPTTAEPIDLTPPGLSAEEQAIAAYVKQLTAIAEVINVNPATLDEAKASYAAVRSLAVPDYQIQP